MPARLAPDAADRLDHRRHPLAGLVHQVTSDPPVYDEVCGDRSVAVGNVVRVAVEIELGFVADGGFEGRADYLGTRLQDRAI